MYKIESLYEPAIEGLLSNVKAGRSERWMAAIAFWFGKQQFYNAKEYWLALGAKILSELSAADQEAIKSQLNKEEDAAVDNVGDWPEIPPAMASQIATWDPEPAEVDLNVLREEAVAEVNRGAVKARSQYLTAGIGMELVYAKKLKEAEAKLANASIANDSIPHIVNEAAINGISTTEMAQMIVDTEAQWTALSAPIEQKRMEAKKAISEAETAEAIRAAANFNWS